MFERARSVGTAVALFRQAHRVIGAKKPVWRGADAVSVGSTRGAVGSFCRLGGLDLRCKALFQLFRPPVPLAPHLSAYSHVRTNIGIESAPYLRRPARELDGTRKRRSYTIVMRSRAGRARTN